MASSGNDEKSSSFFFIFSGLLIRDHKNGEIFLIKGKQKGDFQAAAFLSQDKREFSIICGSIEWILFHSSDNVKTLGLSRMNAFPSFYCSWLLFYCIAVDSGKRNYYLTSVVRRRKTSGKTKAIVFSGRHLKKGFSSKLVSFLLKRSISWTKTICLGNHCDEFR